MHMSRYLSDDGVRRVIEHQGVYTLRGKSPDKNMSPSALLRGEAAGANIGHIIPTWNGGEEYATG